MTARVILSLPRKFQERQATPSLMCSGDSTVLVLAFAEAIIDHVGFCLPIELEVEYDTKALCFKIHSKYCTIDHATQGTVVEIVQFRQLVQLKAA